jgi:DNA-3-methyladenine glycosylase II
MDVITSEADLEFAIKRLISIEPRFHSVLEKHGLPSLRRMEPGLKSLLRIVTDQLISLKAGEAIWKRLEARLADFNGPSILALSEEELKGLGLSRAKARTFHAAAKFFLDLNYAALDQMGDQDVIVWLTSIHGVGPWTADIYLLSVSMRADAWPAGDLALQVAAQDLLGLPKRPDPKAMRGLAETWRPVRAAAARLLWSHYRGLKGMNQRVI